MEKTRSFFPGDQYVPSRLTKFLWWLSTAEKELLQDCVVDRNRYSIVGMSVLGTWLFAILAWTYFFSTANDNPLLFVPLGIFIGCIILSIDRALIKGINRKSNKKFVALSFRVLLAVTIGSFMAQPALLYLFRSEIRLQVSLDNESKRAIKKQAIDAFNKSRLQELTAEQKAIEQNQSARYAEVSKARQDFISETDGSGGSGKVGIKDIALAKKATYEKLDADYKRLSDSNAIQLNRIQQSLNGINADMAKQNAAFEQYFNTGFLTQIEALNNLIKTNTALQMRYYLLLLILVLIELMPVIAKSILPEGSYEEKLRLQEALEITMAQNDSERELFLKEEYHQLIRTQTSKDLADFFEITAPDKKAKMQELSGRWREEPDAKFSELIEEFKDKVLT